MAKKNIRGLVSELGSIIHDRYIDVEKFDSGNNAAGARIRKAMQNVKNKAQEIRVAVITEKNRR